jgi:hypothetical protein
MQTVFGTALVVVVLLTGTSLPASAGPQSSAADTAALVQFNKRVQEYASMHRRLEGAVPTVAVSEDMAEVQRAMTALAAKIRHERRRAHEGDILGGQVAVVFRRYIREGCDGAFDALLKMVNDEAEVQPRPRVNERYPDGATFSMIPPGVLCKLPPLPDELEYRFINRDLVLRDLHANIIVDVLRDAIPESTR